jgi:8-oxo-dGTP pyrophosphatase MutT (NUDIX family)
MTSQIYDKHSCGTLTWKFSSSGGFDILLVKQFKDSEAWSLPKGHINESESPEECARRETFEETGVLVSITRPLGDFYVRLSRRESGTKRVTIYLASPCGTTLTNPKGPESDVADAEWYNVNSLPNLQTSQRDFILAGLKEVEREINELM